MEKCLLCGNVVDHSISKICIDCIKKEYSLSNKDLTNVKQCPNVKDTECYLWKIVYIRLPALYAMKLE
jgi:NMD protein affecting ribosome stability and mRNA decay